MRDRRASAHACARALSLLSTTALLARAQPPPCFVRLLNELAPPGPPASLASSGAGGLVVATAAAGAAAPTWAAVGACGVTSQLTVSAEGFATSPALSLPGDGGSDGGFFSLIVFAANGSAQLELTALPDATTPLPFAPRNIDAAALRIVNARAAPVLVFGAATECYNCALPRLGRAGALGTAPLAVGLSASLALALELRT